MIIVDSSVWIDYFNAAATREAELLDDLLSKEVLASGDLILTEVLQGARSERQFRLFVDTMSALETYVICGYEIALGSARNYRSLRANGITPRKTIDVIIATFCIEHGHTLLHSDRDFDLMREPLGLVTL